MLVSVLGPDQLLVQLDRLGYTVAPDALGRAVDYYLARSGPRLHAQPVRARPATTAQ